MLVDSLLILAGSGLLALTVWRRRGRSGGRGWAAELYNRQAYLFWIPGFALILVATGIIGIAEALDARPAAYVAAMIFLVGGTLSMWGGLFLRVPMWFLPSWLRPVVARQQSESRERRENRRRRRAEKRAGAR